MKLLEYLTPQNPIALWIVYSLTVLFSFWLGLLFVGLWRHIQYVLQIRRCTDISELRLEEDDETIGELASATLVPRRPIEETFDSFRLNKNLPNNGPIARHLRALFDAGRNESQLDVRGLIKNTTDQLFRINTLHRSLLSIFIILGLLGTLFGLADTMVSLDELLRGTAQLNNDTLNLSLQRLLGTLKGAFAPSILGVSLTVLGVLIFAFYMRFVALPLGGLLERITLTVWVPQLVPTASQKLLDKLQLSERQMQKSFEAAKDVADFAKDIQLKTGTFSKTLDEASETLSQTGRTAGELATFSQNFVTGVRALLPFQQDLRSLYQQMVDESRLFQKSVQQNIAGSEDFRQQIQKQLDTGNQQLVDVLKALQTYEAAYISNRQGIDEKLGAVLLQAEKAFQSLAQRNEEITQALDATLGKPLRQDLAVSLSAVQTELQGRLGEINNSLQVQLGSLGEKLRQLDAPLNSAAEKFTDTFSNFEGSTREWLTKLQLEFARQNDTNQQQLERLEGLSKQIPQLLEQLTTSSNNFSESSSSFATHGQQLSQGTTTLSQHIAALGRGIDALNEQVSKQPSGDDRAAEVLGELVDLSQKTTERSARGRR